MKIRRIPLQMTNKDDSLDGTIATLVKGLTKEGSELKGRRQEHLTDVGGTGHIAADNHDYDVGNDDNKDDNYDDVAAASDYNGVGEGGADVTSGNDSVGDGDEYGIGGHGDGEGNDDDDHVVVGDSGGIDEGCNGDRGGVGGGHVNKGNDKGRNGVNRSENSNGNGIAVELDSDHELVDTEDYSEATVLVSNTFPLSVHVNIKEGLVLNGSLLHCKSECQCNCKSYL